MENWEMALGIMYVVMTLATGMIMGWLGFKEFYLKKYIPIWIWLAFAMILLGIVSTMLILIDNLH